MLLPEFDGKRFSYWNTNQWAQGLAMEQGFCPTPRISKEATWNKALDWDTIMPKRSQFLNPERKERLSENAKRILSADVLYGGWMEDRSFLWRGSYMEPSKFRHLGTDFVAPAGTRVCIDESAILVQVYDDTPEIEGWGTRLLFKLWDYPDIHLVFGHLAPMNRVEWRLGTTYDPGATIGHLGTPEQNGGWSSHLHVQAILGDVQEYLNNPASLDGYGELSDLEGLAKRFPDPLRYIRIV